MYEYIGILLGARPILHISRIKVNPVEYAWSSSNRSVKLISDLHLLHDLTSLSLKILKLVYEEILKPLMLMNTLNNRQYFT
jgi:hypothetical protein